MNILARNVRTVNRGHILTAIEFMIVGLKVWCLEQDIVNTMMKTMKIDKKKVFLNAMYGSSALRICHNLLFPFKLCKWMYLDINSMYPTSDDYTIWVWQCKKDLTRAMCRTE